MLGFPLLRSLLTVIALSFAGIGFHYLTRTPKQPKPPLQTSLTAKTDEPALQISFDLKLSANGTVESDSFSDALVQTGVLSYRGKMKISPENPQFLLRVRWADHSPKQHYFAKITFYPEGQPDMVKVIDSAEAVMEELVELPDLEPDVEHHEH